LAVTGELVKPRRRAFVARPAVKAANEHSLPLPRQVEAVFLQARVPPETGTGSNGGFASANFYIAEYIGLRKEKNHGDKATEISLSSFAGHGFYCCAFGLFNVYRCLEHTDNGSSIATTFFNS
jgi:hypothetical protein